MTKLEPREFAVWFVLNKGTKYLTAFVIVNLNTGISISFQPISLYEIFESYFSWPFEHFLVIYLDNLHIYSKDFILQSFNAFVATTSIFEQSLLGIFGLLYLLNGIQIDPGKCNLFYLGGNHMASVMFLTTSFEFTKEKNSALFPSYWRELSFKVWVDHKHLEYKHLRYKARRHTIIFSFFIF